MGDSRIRQPNGVMGASFPASSPPLSTICSPKMVAADLASFEDLTTASNRWDQFLSLCSVGETFPEISPKTSLHTSRATSVHMPLPKPIIDSIRPRVPKVRAEEPQIVTTNSGVLKGISIF